ncbi:Anoctamin-1 [Nymphon striatum]|nr:Anoctamin-1 [Nymphon striatum]
MLLFQFIFLCFKFVFVFTSVVKISNNDMHISLCRVSVFDCRAIKKFFRRIKCTNKISPEKLDIFTKEKLKPKLGEFTREELTEKVVMYGFLLLFAASFPLAPLIALVTMTIDMRIDATRLLFWNRRPIAYRHHGIGIWFEIIRFVNLCGVVTNGLLITFTSSYGKFESIEWKLIFFICFEEKSLVTESLIEGMKHNYEKKLKGYKDNNDSPPNSPKNSPKSKHRFAEKYKHLYKRLD